MPTATFLFKNGNVGPFYPLCLWTVEENIRQRENSPGERVRKLKAMFARGTMVSMQLSPLVSIKSWRVMAVGSMWCSLNGRMKACKTHVLDQVFRWASTGSGTLTFPKMGRSTDPQVSAPQWTSPEAKSAVRIPATKTREVTRLNNKSRATAAVDTTVGTFAPTLTDTQQDEPQMSQMKVGK